ncbi:F18 fimbrial subunit FedE [Escherichia coli]|uniref:F18 fimbrial subunit FedE n=1 Tax=Escherichia coli TaxID=562 RepID=UPI0016503FA8|nr:F18 fimbrial subunit FedE [Escherichia coli]
MTGEGFRVMKFPKIALIALIMVMMISDVEATNSTTAVLTINVTFTPPSCDIKMPSSYDLGILTPGRKEHGNFQITWNCEGNEPIKTALTASIIYGVAEGDNKVRLIANNQPLGATLFLKEKNSGSLIKLTGHDAQDYFCSDSRETTGMRICTLIPVTETSLIGPFGRGYSTLSFAIAYP